MAENQIKALAQAKNEEHLQKIHSVYKPMSEEVPLPSEGFLYKNKTSSITIKPMTAKEEDILSNQQLIQSGKVFDELIKSCVIDWKGLTLEELLVGDKNAILIAIRVISLGDLYEVEVTCPSCLRKNSIEVSLLNDLKIKNMDFELFNNSENKILWKSPEGISYVLRLLNHNDQKQMEEEAKRKKAMFKTNYKESPISDFLLNSIISIEGINQRSDIAQILSNAPSKEVRSLIKFIKEISPDYDMSYDFECNTCSYLSNVNIPFSVGFFWPEGRSARK